MKLKYKKMIIMISMCTMGIGLVTFSINEQSKENSTPVEKTSEETVAYNAKAVVINEDQDTLLENLPTVTPTPTEVPLENSTLKMVATDVLEKDAHADINKLIKKYLKAKLTDKEKNFKELVNDVSLLDLKDIERKTKYIEEYQNLACYTRKGPEEGSFIVYAYHEVKFTSIETLAPAMNEFYIKTDENGDPYIYLGEIDDTTEQYLTEVRESDEVMDLIYSVDEKLRQAEKDDGALDEFCLKLEESAQNVTQND